MPLRADLWAKLALPPDMTAPEAEKLIFFIRAMVVPAQLALPAEEPDL